MMKKILVVIYKLYLSFQLLKLILLFVKIRKNIPKVTFMLMSTKNKISSRN